MPIPRRPIPGQVLDPQDTFSLAYAPEFYPQFIQFSPGGEMFGVTMDDPYIHKIGPDGKVAVYLAFTEVIACIGFDTSGNLWFTTGSNKLFRTTEEKTPQFVAEGVNRIFYVNPEDDLIAVDYWGLDKTVQKITPDGRVSILASGIDINKFAIGPNSEIVILNNSGELHELLENGEMKLITSGLYVDIGLAFGPDRLLYVYQGYRLDTIDPETGKTEFAEWLSGKYLLPNGQIVFDRQGSLYAFHPNDGVYQIDLENKIVKNLFLTKGNTQAMALDKQDAVYVAYGDRLFNGETTLYKIAGINDLEAIAKIPAGTATGLAIDREANIAYLGVNDYYNGNDYFHGLIYSIELDTGRTAEYAKTNQMLSSITVNPANGQVWWGIVNDGVYYRTEDGNSVRVSVPKGVNEIKLDFGPDGSLYAVMTFERPQPASPQRKVYYQMAGDGHWMDLADLSTTDASLWLATPAVCSNGIRYAIASIDAHRFGAYPASPSFNAVIRLEEDNSLTLLGYDFSFDGFVADCAQSGELLFTSGAGVYRFTDKEPNN